MRKGRLLRLWLTGVGMSLLVLGLAPAGASSANISHSYKGTGSIPNGSVVSLDPKRSDYVQPANTANGTRLLGVALAGDDSLLAVDASPGTIQVATSGNAIVLVSTLGGDIDVGDQVSVSPFNGVGMKASPGSRVIGLAQTAFNRDSQNAKLESVTDKSGKSSQVAVGFTRVTLAVGTGATDVAAQNLNSAQRVVRSITGHTVSTLRITISLIIVAVSLVALITLVYASIYGSIISVGRNPLAKYAVFRTLGSVVGMAVLTTVVASVTVYFLLR